jgi:hypothetical protein
VDNRHIIDEIVRTARKNNGVPLGKRKFACKTKIKESDWLKYSPIHSDAQIEAGYKPNEPKRAFM